MITVAQRYNILDALGLKEGDINDLWTKLDTVQTVPEREAKVLEVLGEIALITRQRLLQGTKESGLTKANGVEKDPHYGCRNTSEVTGEWRQRLARLVGWTFVVTTDGTSEWF